MILTLRILSLVIPYCITICKCITFLLLPTSIKTLMEWIQNDWNTLEDVNELEIIKKYANFGRLCTITFSVFSYSCAFALLLSVYLPDILNFVMPQNFSRERNLLFDVEYFIDEQKYFYVIFYHLYISIIFGLTIVIATETLYVAYVNHACGMFKIASYRLYHAYDQNVLQISPFIKNAVIHTKVAAAIEMHKRALKFHDFLWSKLGLHYFFMISIGVVSLSINFFRIFQAIVVIKSAEELVLSGIFIAAHFIYIFCGNYAGQVFIDHSLGVHENICDSRWYRIPLRQQKLILLILHRSMHSCKLVTGGIFILSLEGFTSLLAMSISYFTVISSIQH
ncbi:uncharacterized protein LOC113003298 isoform X2 [Solenopsis invicta]|uniref:uncharacterized protein LOC113003298 isoform X2 n=1 Tax=Solenopsis invicta TaxID=13686 RepID=UPI00193E3DAB|nr:uncharacterized protein LOC113003298 isoform X2 [Solenopsis invicta]